MAASCYLIFHLKKDVQRENRYLKTMRSPDEYILKAEGFERLAQDASLIEHRDFYLALAREYRDLAEAAERLRPQSAATEVTLPASLDRWEKHSP